MVEILNFLKRVQAGIKGLQNMTLFHHTRHEDGNSDEINVQGLSGELADQQKPKAHTLASHSTKAHSELTGVTASQHHPKTVASELNLADMAEKSHPSLTNVSPDQHHPQSHTLASHSTKAHSELTGVTASQHHTDPKAQPKCRAYQSSAQSIPTGTYTKVNLQTENYDVGGNFASSRFTALKPGYYLCIGNLRYRDMSVDDAICAYLYKNGSVHAWRDNFTTLAGHPIAGLSDIIYLAINNYVELYTAHWHGSNRNLEALSQSTFLAVCLLAEA